MDWGLQQNCWGFIKRFLIAFRTIQTLSPNLSKLGDELKISSQDFLRNQMLLSESNNLASNGFTCTWPDVRGGKKWVLSCITVCGR